MKPFFRPKLYLSARISPDAHERNNRVASYLTEQFDVFKPHEHQVCVGRHEDIGIGVYLMDLTAMENSELSVLVPNYGRDCAWEIGWYKGAGKPVYVYVEEQTDWLRDAMIKGGISHVFTSNIKMSGRLMVDPILKYKFTYIETPEHLGMAVLKMFNDMKNGRVVING